jgi:predicted heme/steroid binding protein
MRTFTIKELAGYDGSNGVAYVAFEGRVYDVSPSFLWRGVNTRSLTGPAPT